MAPEHVVWVGLRLTEDAWDNFQRARDAEALTNRAAVEAAMQLVALFCVPSQERRAAVAGLFDVDLLENVVIAAWEAIIPIGDRHRKGRETRFDLNVQTEKWRRDQLAACLGKRGRITMNDAINSVFTPWGSGWHRGVLEAARLRQELWPWAAGPARGREQARSRRRRRPGSLSIPTAS